MYKYKTTKIQPNNLIEKVEIKKETDKSVWTKYGRTAKNGRWDQYHDTWQQAKDYLKERAGFRLDAAHKELHGAKDHYETVKSLVEI